MGFNKNFLLMTMCLSLTLSTHAIPNSLDSIIAPSLPPASAPNSNDGTVNTSPEITHFCGVTENPSLCAKTITPYLQQGSFDPIQALETEIKATLNQTKKVTTSISDSLSNPSTEGNARKALGVCQTQYDTIVATINEASELLLQQNVVDAYFKFSSVISDHTTCEDAFLDYPDLQIPFADESNSVFQLAGNCVSIMDGIVNGRT